MASKNELLEETKQIEEAIVAEVQQIRELAWQKLKIGLTVVFVGFGTYWLVKKYLGHPVQYQDLAPSSSLGKKEETNQSVVGSQQEFDIVQMIKKEIAVFLLAIAKQKIQELLQNLYQSEYGEEEIAEE